MSGRQLKVDLIANTSQFKRAMSETSNQMKLINSEFRSAAAETDKYGNRIDATGAKKKQLSGVLEQYKQRIVAIKNEQKHWTAELEKGNITEEQHAQKQQELARRLNNTEAEMKRYEGQLKRLNAEGKATTRTWADFDKGFRDVGRTMRNVGAQVGITAGVGFVAMKRVLGDVVEEAKSFEYQMSEVGAISGATADEMKILTDQSKELGRQTMFTAQQAAESQANLARAGFNTQEIYDAMPGMLELAASSKLELGNAANITSNIIRTFNFEASEAGRVADVLAKGAATANTDVQGLGQAMEVAGPVAHSLGIELEQVAAGAGIMADAGIDGSKSGRMLRQGMLRLSKPTGEAAKQLKKMKVEAFDADGNMKSLDKVVGELEKGLKGQTKQQRAAALATIFGSESTAGWTVLLDKGSKELKDYTKQLKDSEGAAKDMADTMQDNAQGAIIRMQSALSGLKIELGEKLLPILGRGADIVSNFTNKLSEMDEATIQTIAETALLVTAVLGVTTAVAGLVAGIGAFMAFAGPVGLAIAGGTALLGGLAAAIYVNEQKTKSLKEEQEKAQEEAIRYGEGLSEGTREGVRGYVDLYEGAKLKMHQLKTMSGEEAEKTKAEVVKAFRDMGDEVVSELEKFASEFGEVVNKIYGVYEDEGQKRAEEINKQVQKDVEEMITSYEEASNRLAEIVDEFGNDTSKMPKEVEKAYKANLEIMRQGAEVFATTYEDALEIRNTIASNKDKILFEEAEKWAGEIDKVHREGVESINEQYVKQAEVFEQFKILYPEHAEIYDELMQTLSTSTTAEYLKINEAREESLRVLHENIDEEGRLIDLSTGKELERIKVWEKSSDSHTIGMRQRMETDEEYYLRYLETSDDYLKALETTNKESLNRIESQAKDWALQMGYTEKEATEFAKTTRENVLKEMEKGDDRAEKAGKDKGEAHADGIKSTERQNVNNADKLSGDVTSALGRTTDGGGGRKAGQDVASGLTSQTSRVRRAGVSVAGSAEGGLKQFNTGIIANSFVSGFVNNISSGTGTVWSTAWNLGKTALNALKRSIDSRSPSRLTGEEGFNFAEGFIIAIDDGKRKAVNSAKLLGKESIDAFSNEVESYKNSFGALALGIEESKQTLKVEHEFTDFSRMLDMELKGQDDRIDKLIRLVENIVTSRKEPAVINLHVGSKRIARELIEDINQLQGREITDYEIYKE